MVLPSSRGWVDRNLVWYVAEVDWIDGMDEYLDGGKSLMASCIVAFLVLILIWKR